MSEEGFHEIQLSGKQLVFLFMATTVVAVVIFLCGVMVGRGVRAEAASEAETIADLSTQPALPPGDVNPAAPQPRIDTGTAPPQPVNDELSYYSRLEKPETPAETLKPSGRPTRASDAAVKAAASSPAGPPAPAASTPADASSPPAKPAPPAASAAPPSAAAAPLQGAFAVQVAALGSRADAAALAERLTGKGYDAYVVMPTAGSAAVYRVRVGRFKTRQEADATARRLEKEEKFKPWVIR